MSRKIPNYFERRDGDPLAPTKKEAPTKDENEDNELLPSSQPLPSPLSQPPTQENQKLSSSAPEGLSWRDPPSYWRVPVADSPDENLKKHFYEVCEWISSAVSSASPSCPTPKVLIHCQLGRSRSATVALAYGMKGLGHSLASGLNILKEK